MKQTTEMRDRLEVGSSYSLFLCPISSGLVERQVADQRKAC